MNAAIQFGNIMGRCSKCLRGGGSELTIREIVKPTAGSRGTVRLHFSNYFGTSPITLGAVYVGSRRREQELQAIRS